MIFLTVGTQFPFDRLVLAVDEALDNGATDHQLFAQIGKSSYRPRNFKCVSSLDKQAFDECIEKASCVIGHAGVGTIVMALDNNKPLLVMPRLKRYGEVVNDHQLTLAKKFESLGYLLVAYDADNIAHKIEQLKSFVPARRTASAKQVSDRINEFLQSL